MLKFFIKRYLFSWTNGNNFLPLSHTSCRKEPMMKYQCLLTFDFLPYLPSRYLQQSRCCSVSFINFPSSQMRNNYLWIILVYNRRFLHTSPSLYLVLDDKETKALTIVGNNFGTGWCCYIGGWFRWKVWRNKCGMHITKICPSWTNWN